jgi:hypothetical protein
MTVITNNIFILFIYLFFFFDQYNLTEKFLKTCLIKLTNKSSFEILYKILNYLK